jgi:hypothetical protein
VPDKENTKHFTGTKKCAGTKHHKGRQPDWCFVEAEPPEQGGEQLPFVKKSKKPFLNYGLFIILNTHII